MTDDLFLRFTERLHELGLRYMVTGSVAATVYGEPRLTHDVDVVLELSADDDVEALYAAFPEEDFYCAPLEVLKVEARRPQRGHFNIIDHETGFKADVYLTGQDEFHAWALEHRTAIPVGDSDVYFAPMEYVIVRKLTYYREGGSEKHVTDIVNMIQTSPEALDDDELDRWIERYGLREEWERVLGSGRR